MHPVTSISMLLSELHESDFATQVDVICNAFEDTWLSGVHPSVQEFASLASSQFRRRILRELILTELECFEHLPHPAQLRDPLAEVHVSTHNEATVQNASETEETVSTLPQTKSLPPTLPSHIDRFAINRFLGKGSFGTVYEAEDVQLRRRVALKIALPSTGEEQPFAREASHVSSVEHPAIVPVLDIGQWRGVHYMVSELVEGQNLQQFSQSTDVDHATAVAIVIDLAEAMAACHKNSIIHRDLKPSNIMVQDVDEGPAEGPKHLRIRVLDFGIAKNLDRSTQHTLQGDLVGTPHYMSPEQANGSSASVDARSDIFSIGVILFELLAKQRPFEGMAMPVVLAIRDKTAPKIRSIAADIPVGLEAIVEKCLQRVPADRYQSASDLVTDLRLWNEGCKPKALCKANIKKRLKMSLVGAAIVAIMILAAWVLMSTAPNGRHSVNRLMALDVDRERLEQQVESSNLMRWIDRGNLSSLNRWIALHADGDAKASMEADEVRLTQISNESQEWRKELWESCIRIESDEVTIEKLAEKLINECLELQRESVLHFLEDAPIGLLTACSRRVIEVEKDRSQSEVLITTSKRLSKEGSLSQLLPFLKRASDRDTADLISAVSDVVVGNHDWGIELMAEFAKAPYEPKAPDEELEQSARWRAKLAAMAYRIGETDLVDRILSFDLLPQSRAYFIYYLSTASISLIPLLERLPTYKDDWKASGAVACISNRIKTRGSDSQTPADDELRELFRNLYAEHPSGWVHSQAKTMLLDLGESEFVAKVDCAPESRLIGTERNWFMNSLGMQMNIVRAPVDFWFGYPPNHPKPGRLLRLELSFAYSVDLVSSKSISSFDLAPATDDSANRVAQVSWIEATRFCDLLNRNELGSEHVTLTKLEDGMYDLRLPKVGYRLPSVWEWECFARSGAAIAESDMKLNSKTGLPKIFDGFEWTVTTYPIAEPRAEQPRLFLDSNTIAVKGAISERYSTANFKLTKTNTSRPVHVRLFYSLDN